jgi:F0F1-type ATP synthase assembly protein I
MMDYLKYFNLGAMIVSPSIVGLFLGAWMDSQMRTFPMFTVSLILLGIVAGFWSLYKSIKDIK